MTDLRALSNAATQGVWEARDLKGDPFIQADNESIARWAYTFPECSIPMTAEDVAFITALVNAYRTGELVPREEAEAERARIIRELAMVELANIETAPHEWLQGFLCAREIVEGEHHKETSRG